jgi:hypothetical protein
MRTIWKILKYDLRKLKDVSFIPYLNSESFVLIILIALIYLVGVVSMTFGLYSLVEYPCMTGVFGNYTYLALIWCISSIINVFIFEFFPGISFLDKNIRISTLFYIFAGPFLYPRIFCLWLILLAHSNNFRYIIHLLNIPVDKWEEYTDALVPSIPRVFIESIAKYRRYLRE